MSTIKPVDVQLADGKQVVFRALEEADAPLLGHYLEELSEETRSKWRPHDFTAETAQKLCANQATDPSLRLVAVNTLEGKSRVDETIIAYFILHREVGKADADRFLGYGRTIVPGATCQFAPSVADAYQNLGLAARSCHLCLMLRVNLATQTSSCSVAFTFQTSRRCASTRRMGSRLQARSTLAQTRKIATI